MKNSALERAVAAVGGVVGAAYKLKRSVTAVNAWRAAGRIPGSADAITLARMSAEAGEPVTVEELAGLATPMLDGGPRQNKAKKKQNQACLSEVARQVSRPSPSSSPSALRNAA